MHAIILGSPLKAILAIGRSPASVARALPVADEGIMLGELRAASDRLRSRLDEALLSRTELIALSVDLEPVARVLLQLRKSHTQGGAGREATRAQTHAVRLLDTALHDIYEVLYFTRPWRPYIWPGALQAKLQNAQNSVAHAIVALRWARIG